MATSSGVSNSKLWDGIWKAEVSTQCKNLVWRACKETLPVKSFLIEKGILCDDGLCPSCGESSETTAHALLQCEEVKRIWFASPLSLRVDSLQHVATVSQWIDQCVDILDKKQMGVVCAVMWALWQRRNVLVMLHKKVDFAHVIEKALSMIVPVQWCPPVDPYIKANFCACVKDPMGTGMGVVFRDSSGAPLASATNLMVEECFAPEIADALCFHWAIGLVGELCFSDVIFETDSRLLYAEWNRTRGESGSYLESLVDDCRYMCDGSSLTFVRVSANKVALSLAVASFVYGERVCMEEVLEEAYEYLQADGKGIANLSKDQ